jgi:hypothetical protein
VKLRLSRELHGRALDCAEAVDEPLGRYIRTLVNMDAKGVFPCVATDDSALSTTRADSVVITIPPIDRTPDQIRESILRGVTYAEARNPPKFIPPYKAGKDYVVIGDPY